MNEPTAHLPSVTVIVPVRNERESLPALIEVIEAQTLRPAEVIIADGRSTDGTRQWLQDACASRRWLRVIDNPDRVIPAAMNRLVEAATAQIVARMDAHATYGVDYLRQLVRVLASHPELAGAGGLMRTQGEGPWGAAIAAVLASPWGLGGAPHRVEGAPGPVDHTFCTAYWRKAVVAVGGWDRHLLANEDVELDYRIVQAVGPLWLVPDAGSIWWTRRTPGALVRQMWRYGYYRARTAHLHPRTFKRRHLAPVVIIVGPPLVGLWRRPWGLAVAGTYLVVSALVGGTEARRRGVSTWRAAATIPIVHLSWGAGLLVGLVRHMRARPEPGLVRTEQLSSVPLTASAGRGPREELLVDPFDVGCHQGP